MCKVCVNLIKMWNEIEKNWRVGFEMKIERWELVRELNEIVIGGKLGCD